MIRYRGQASGYQWAVGPYQGGGVGGTNYWAEERLKVVLYNGEYSQYFVLTVNGK